MSGAPTAYSPTQSVAFAGPLATVKPIVPPGFTVGVFIVTDGGGGASSLVIVPMPWPSPINAFVAFDRLTVKVSFGSTAGSPFTVTLIVCVATDELNVSVPVAAT